MKAEEEQRLFWNVATDAERRCQEADLLVTRLEAEQQALLKRLRAARREFHLAFLERAELTDVLVDSGFGEEQILKVRREVKAEVEHQTRQEVLAHG